jgi:adenylylsulfate kinase-like enzyme
VTALSDERDLPRSVLVTGVYGAGKSTVVQDLAILLEEAGVPYAAIDLDWLSWYDAGVDGDDGWDMLLANLAAVAGNYRSAGVTRLAMAGFFESAADVERLRSVLAMPLATVRLEVPLTVVEQRLSAEGTTERLANLVEARRQLAEGRGRGFADLAVAGDCPTREISLDILNWLGWLG